MPDGSVALEDTENADPLERLIAALGRESLAVGAAPAEVPDGGWFLFETPHGTAAFRPISLGGIAAPAPREEDGAAAAKLIEGAEFLIAGIERAIGVAIDPNAIGQPPEGVAARVEAGGDEGGIVEVIVPEAVAAALPPPGAAYGAVVHRVRMPAPALGMAEIPASGDLLILGHQVSCEINPTRPVGALAFAGTVTTGEDASVPTTPVRAGAEVTFETVLNPAQASAVKGGAALRVAEGAMPSATFNTGESIRTGTLIPLGGVVYFRFD